MPISKTCYFCEEFDICFSENNNAENVVTDIGILCSCFTPNADWLYIEGLEKENKELRKQLETIQQLTGKSYYQTTYSTTKMPTIKDISPLKETNSRWSNRTDDVKE